ncbi:MAG: hypothetical protein ACI8VC_000782 [Candidatus Endobugula sp.]|jgi:hypothetical protein
MANDKHWQRRSDEWISATNKSRLDKEQETSKRNAPEKPLNLTTDIHTNANNLKE